MKIRFEDKIIIIFILIIMVTTIFINIYSHRSEKILMNYVSLKSTNIISAFINKSIVKILYEEKSDNIIKDYKD